MTASSPCKEQGSLDSARSPTPAACEEVHVDDSCAPAMVKQRPIEQCQWPVATIQAMLDAQLEEISKRVDSLSSKLEAKIDSQERLFYNALQLQVNGAKLSCVQVKSAVDGQAHPRSKEAAQPSVEETAAKATIEPVPEQNQMEPPPAITGKLNWCETAGDFNSEQLMGPLQTNTRDYKAVDEKILNWWETVAEEVSETLIKFNCAQACTETITRPMRMIGQIEEPPRTGTLASIADSNFFSLICFSIIGLNAAYIVVTSDARMQLALARQEESNDLDVIETCFAVFYCIELTLRLAVHRGYFFINRDAVWNTFDFVLVVFGVFEIVTFVVGVDTGSGGNLNFLRLVRAFKLVKVFRVFRTLKFIQELRLKIDLLMHSMSQVAWWLLLIIFVLFLFSLVFVQGLSNFVLDSQNDASMNAEERDQFMSDMSDMFGTVTQGMVSLFKANTGGVDWGDQYAFIIKIGTQFAAAYLFFIAFFAIAVWNIVTSAFVEKTFKLAIPDLDYLIMEKHKKDVVYARDMMNIFQEEMDADTDGHLSVAEFNKCLDSGRLESFFAVRNMDVKDVKSFFTMLQSMNASENSPEGESRVSLRTFVAAALRLQGNATSVDLQTLHFEMKKFHLVTQKNFATVAGILAAVQARPVDTTVSSV